MEKLPPDVEKPGDRVATLQSIAHAAQRLFSADLCAVQSLNPVTEKLYELAVLAGRLQAEYSEGSIQPQLEAIAERAIKQGGTYVEDQNAPRGAITSGLRGISTVVATVLYTKREKKPVAVLLFGFSQPREFTSTDFDLLTLLSTQYSPLLENIWLLNRYREVVKIGQEINQTLKKPQELFEQLYEKVSTIFDTRYFFMLAVYHQQNGTADFHTAYKGVVNHAEGGTLIGGCAYVINKQEPLIEVNYSKNPNRQVELEPILDTEPPYPESLIFVPLIFRKEPLGVLSIQRLQPNSFDNEDLQIMTLLGNQVALAMSDLRLFEYLEALNETGQQLTSQLTADEVLDSVVERIRNATKADLVTLYPYIYDTGKPVVERFGKPHTSGDLREPSHVSYTVRDDDIAWLTLQKEGPVWANDSTQLFEMLGGDQGNRKGNFEQREGVSSTAALALRIEGLEVGALFINYRHRQLFKAAQKHLILGLANFAAIAINNNNRFRELSRRRLDELEALRHIDQEISRALKLRDVLTAILKCATDYVGGEDASFFLFNPNTQRLETEVCIGRRLPQYEVLTIPVSGEGIVPWVYNNRQSALVGNVKTSPEFRHIYKGVVKETTSELDVPLKDGDEVIGVINIESSKENAFSKADEIFLNTLAGQAVLAIKNAQTYERAQAGERSREAYREVAKKIIAQEGNHEEVIRVILKEARGLINAEIGIFQQYENGQPRAFYVDAENEEIDNALYNGLDRDQISGILDQGIVRYVADTKQPYTTLGLDAKDDDHYKGSPHIHSETAVPLLGEDNALIGVLDLESPRPFAFRADDERVLDLFGELAVIAFKNARNYSRAKRESERFSLLYEAGQELSEITDPSKLDSAYRIVLMKVGKFSDGEAVIRYYDPATEELLLADVERKRATEPMPSIPKSEGVNGQVARELRTIRVDDLEHLPPGVAQPIGDDPAIKTLVVTPLIFKQSYYGNLVLSHEQANSFDDADISLLEGLARQLAITIHRLEIVKAIGEAEQHAKNLKVMSEVGQSAMEVAHRLGNELKPVDIYIGNIRQIIESEGIEHQEIEANLDKVGKDVKSLIHMAKGLRHKIADLGKLELERSIVPVTALLENVEWSLHSPENVIVRSEVESDLPDVSVVPGLVIDILRNLFTNAVEAMPEGGTITIRASYDRRLAGNSSQYVLIEVEDTGTGVLTEMQPKIFNLFFSTKKSSGFGLWSARQYARANGGELELLRSEKHVTTFALTLPVAPKQ